MIRPVCRLAILERHFHRLVVFSVDVQVVFLHTAAHQGHGKGAVPGLNRAAGNL